MRPSPAVAVILLVALGGLVGAGCSGGGSGDGVATLEATTTSAGRDPGGADEADLEEALLAFTACMRDEGIDLPDPEFDAEGNLRLSSLMGATGLAAGSAEGVDALRAAASACRSHLEGVTLRFSSLDRTEIQDRLVEYAGCIREHGFDLPDPDFSAGSFGPGAGMGRVFGGLTMEVFQDPAFQEANEVCQGIFAGLEPAATVPGDSE